MPLSTSAPFHQSRQYPRYQIAEAVLLTSNAIYISILIILSIRSFVPMLLRSNTPTDTVLPMGATVPDIKTIVHEWVLLRDSGEWDCFAQFYRNANASGVIAFLATYQGVAYWTDPASWNRFVDFFENDHTRQVQRSDNETFERWCSLLPHIARFGTA
jgi:hypothetical protein